MATVSSDGAENGESFAVVAAAVASSEVLAC